VSQPSNNKVYYKAALIICCLGTLTGPEMDASQDLHVTVMVMVRVSRVRVRVRLKGYG